MENGAVIDFLDIVWLWGGGRGTMVIKKIQRPHFIVILKFYVNLCYLIFSMVFQVFINNIKYMNFLYIYINILIQIMYVISQT